MAPNSYNTRLNPLLWIGLPIFVYIYPYASNLPSINLEEGVYREYGFVENRTAVFLALTLFFGIRLIIATSGFRRIYYLFFNLGVLYFLGEEISWGQFYFSWNTPETYASINTQEETNLHNLPGIYNELFAKIPRLMLSILSLVGGGIIPLFFLYKTRSFKPDSIHAWIWPSFISIVTVFFINAVALPYRIAHALDRELPQIFDIESSELKECFIALFLLLYMLTSRKHHLSEVAGSGPEDTPGDRLPAP